jgi:hypothetical protein
MDRANDLWVFINGQVVTVSAKIWNDRFRPYGKNPGGVSDCFVFDLMSDMKILNFHQNKACLTKILCQNIKNCKSFYSPLNQRFYNKSYPTVSIFLKKLVENVNMDTNIKIDRADLNIRNTP